MEQTRGDEDIVSLLNDLCALCDIASMARESGHPEHPYISITELKNKLPTRAWSPLFNIWVGICSRCVFGNHYQDASSSSPPAQSSLSAVVPVYKENHVTEQRGLRLVHLPAICKLAMQVGYNISQI
jgi:hypothetical protein